MHCVPNSRLDLFPQPLCPGIGDLFFRDVALPEATGTKRAATTDVVEAELIFSAVICVALQLREILPGEVRCF